MSDTIENHSEKNHMLLLAISIILLFTISGALIFSISANSELEVQLSASQLELADLHNKMRIAEEQYSFDTRDLVETPASEPKLIVFFEPEVDNKLILTLQNKWENLDGVKDVDYISSEEAKAEYLNSISPEDLVTYELVSKTDTVLPSSLTILSQDGVDFIALQDAITADVNNEIRKLDSDKLLIQVRAVR